MVKETVKPKYEVLFFPKVHRAVRKVYKDVSAIIKANGVQAGINYLNKTLTNPELTTAISQLYATVGLRFANNEYSSLKQAERGIKKPQKDFYDLETKAFGFTQTWVEWILGYLRQHLIENITYSVNETTKDHLLKVLFKSIAEGMGVDETVSLIDKDEFSETQAARIVRTEVNMSANAGVLAAGETYQYQVQKEWISVHDFRTRGNNPDDHASHVALDGTVIDFEDVFIDPRNGDRLKSPGDPKASAASVINCRCQMSLKPKKDINGRLIPKRKTTVVIYPNQNRRVPTVLI